MTPSTPKFTKDDLREELLVALKEIMKNKKIKCLPKREQKVKKVFLV